MYPCTKFQLIWWTSALETKFAKKKKKKYEWQKVWKNKHWIRYKNIAMYAFTKLSQFAELQLFGPK